MGYKERHLFASNDADFRNAISGAMTHCALDINGEAEGAQGFQLWKARGEMARQVLTMPLMYLDAFTHAALVNTPTLTGDSTDQALYDSVAAVWNDIATNLAG